MQKERDKEETEVLAKKADEDKENRLNHPIISTMEPLTHEAYGGGMYGTDDDQPPPREPPASDTQSADGPSETTIRTQPVHKPPPSSGKVLCKRKLKMDLRTCFDELTCRLKRVERVEGNSFQDKYVKSSFV
ncbi:hypothetical protein R6Q59_019546 [Mikania micrantha]